MADTSFCATVCVQLPCTEPTIRYSGRLATAAVTPWWISSSTNTPAMPRTSSSFPLNPRLGKYSICIWPNCLKSTAMRQAQGSLTMPSNDTTTMPASQACLTAPLSAVGAAPSVAWFSEVVKLGACASSPWATAFLPTLSQLLSMAWRHELPAKLFDSAILRALVSAAPAPRGTAPRASGGGGGGGGSAAIESRCCFMCCFSWGWLNRLAAGYITAPTCQGTNSFWPYPYCPPFVCPP